jgi:tripartite motif-containing protein 71
LKRNLSRRTWLAIGIGLCSFAIILLGLAILTQSNGASILPSIPDSALPSQTKPPHYLFSLDKPGGLLQPMAVTTSATGDIYVADTGHGVVQVFDKDGKFQRTIGRSAPTRPAGNGELIYPVGLALDEDGKLYVADVQAGRIVTFKPDGSFAGLMGQGVITSPIGLLARNGQLFVNDIGAQQVVVLDAAGKVQQRYDAGNALPLAYANYSAFTPEGELAVADSNNNRVVIFAADGSISRTLTTVGQAPLLMPRGLGYDGLGRLHVASVFNHQIDVFDSALNFLYAYGEHGAADGQFSFPNDLWISGNRVYIADRQNNRVQVWKISDNSQ